MLLFRFLSETKHVFRFAITPAVFLEFCGPEAYSSESDFEKSKAFLHRTIAKTNLPMYVFGLRTFREAKSHYKSIQHDVRKIKSAIEAIRTRQWNVELKTELGIKFPHVAAREIAPRIKTKYFSRFHAEMFIQSLVESKIIHSKNTDSYARKKMRSELAISKAKLIENEKNKIKGLGDLSILSVCDIGSQFFHRQSHTVVGVTFDKRLELILSKHSSIHVASGQFVGGKETEETIRRKIDGFFDGVTEIKEINAKAEAFMSSFLDSLGQCSWLRKPSEPQSTATSDEAKGR